MVSMASLAIMSCDAIVGAMTMLCCKARKFSSATNKIEADAIAEMLSKGALHRMEIKIDGRWIPDGWSLGIARELSESNWYERLLLLTCAKTEVNTNDHDPHDFTVDVTVNIPYCVSWDVLTRAINPRDDDDECPRKSRRKAVDVDDDDYDDDDDERSAKDLPKELKFLTNRSSTLRWPQWGLETRDVFEPNVREEDLVTADSLARFMRSMLSSSGSGVFVFRGPGAKGKTSAGLRLAQLLGEKTLVLENWDPTEPGTLLTHLKDVRQQVSDNAHIILMAEEFDGWIEAVRDNTLPPNEELSRQVKNKGSWHHLLRVVQTSKRVILILTANMSDDKYVSGLNDPTLLRCNNRVTAHLTWDSASGRFVAWGDSPSPPHPHLHHRTNTHIRTHMAVNGPSSQAMSRNDDVEVVYRDNKLYDYSGIVDPLLSRDFLA